MTTDKAPGRARAFAPAKINLTLHVTGQRDDGFHVLDSLVVFADLGDWISVEPAPDLRLEVNGPMASGVPVDDSNLVLRAACAAGVESARIVLGKHLPASAGIGGGSSDAAATLRALRASHGIELPDLAGLLALGADLPVCMKARTARMSGIGERVVAVRGIPPLPAVLVNPGVGVSTPDVFRALSLKDGAGMAPMPVFANVGECAGWLAGQRNDLEAPARELAPVIGDVLGALDAAGALLARMSGSGATCFGLFETGDDAARAAADIGAANAGWWVRPSVLAG